MWDPYLKSTLFGRKISKSSSPNRSKPPKEVPVGLSGTSVMHDRQHKIQNRKYLDDGSPLDDDNVDDNDENKQQLSSTFSSSPSTKTTVMGSKFSSSLLPTEMMIPSCDINIMNGHHDNNDNDDNDDNDDNNDENRNKWNRQGFEMKYKSLIMIRKQMIQCLLIFIVFTIIMMILFSNLFPFHQSNISNSKSPEIPSFLSSYPVYHDQLNSKDRMHEDDEFLIEKPLQRLKVSVVLPVYNGLSQGESFSINFLSQTLNSVMKQNRIHNSIRNHRHHRHDEYQNQTYQQSKTEAIEMELIIVNDASKDGTESYLDDFAKHEGGSGLFIGHHKDDIQFKYDNDDGSHLMGQKDRIKNHINIKVIHHQQNKKLPAALNTGHQQVSNDATFVTWISGDNNCTLDFISELIKVGTEFPECGFIYADYYVMDDHGNIIDHVDGDGGAVRNGIYSAGGGRYSYYRTLLGNGGVAAFFYSKEVMHQISTFEKQSKMEMFYDHELVGAEDWDFFLRIAEVSPYMVYRNIPLMYYRIHSKSMTSQMQETKLERDEKVLRKALNRLHGHSSQSTGINMNNSTNPEQFPLFPLNALFPMLKFCLNKPFQSIISIIQFAMDQAHSRYPFHQKMSLSYHKRALSSISHMRQQLERDVRIGKTKQKALLDSLFHLRIIAKLNYAMSLLKNEEWDEAQAVSLEIQEEDLKYLDNEENQQKKQQFHFLAQKNLYFCEMKNTNRLNRLRFVKFEDPLEHDVMVKEHLLKQVYDANSVIQIRSHPRRLHYFFSENDMSKVQHSLKWIHSQGDLLHPPNKKQIIRSMFQFVNPYQFFDFVTIWIPKNELLWNELSSYFTTDSQKQQSLSMRVIVYTEDEQLLQLFNKEVNGHNGLFYMNYDDRDSIACRIASIHREKRAHSTMGIIARSSNDIGNTSLRCSLQADFIMTYGNQDMNKNRMLIDALPQDFKYRLFSFPDILDTFHFETFLTRQFFKPDVLKPRPRKNRCSIAIPFLADLEQNPQYFDIFVKSLYKSLKTINRIKKDQYRFDISIISWSNGNNLEKKIDAVPSLREFTRITLKVESPNSNNNRTSRDLFLHRNIPQFVSDIQNHHNALLMPFVHLYHDKDASINQIATDNLIFFAEAMKQESIIIVPYRRDAYSLYEGLFEPGINAILDNDEAMIEKACFDSDVSKRLHQNLSKVSFNPFRNSELDKLVFYRMVTYSLANKR